MISVLNRQQPLNGNNGLTYTKIHASENSYFDINQPNQGENSVFVYLFDVGSFAAAIPRLQ